MIKLMAIKMFSTFSRFSICSVTEESHNGGLELIAGDYKHSRETKTRKSGCKSCELQRFEGVLISGTESSCRSVTSGVLQGSTGGPVLIGFSSVTWMKEQGASSASLLMIQNREDPSETEQRQVQGFAPGEE